MGPFEPGALGLGVAGKANHASRRLSLGAPSTAARDHAPPPSAETLPPFLGSAGGMPPNSRRPRARAAARAAAYGPAKRSAAPARPAAASPSAVALPPATAPLPAAALKAGPSNAAAWPISTARPVSGLCARARSLPMRNRGTGDSSFEPPGADVSTGALPMCPLLPTGATADFGDISIVAASPPAPPAPAAAPPLHVASLPAPAHTSPATPAPPPHATSVLGDRRSVRCSRFSETSLRALTARRRMSSILRPSRGTGSQSAAEGGVRPPTPPPNPKPPLPPSTPPPPVLLKSPATARETGMGGLCESASPCDGAGRSVSDERPSCGACAAPASPCEPVAPTGTENGCVALKL
eukprot:scaffold921_cov101-Isochrysis_galbana.AAC.3